MKDEEILDLLWARSERALQELDKSYGAAMRKVARKILRSPEDAEECWNDACLQVWNSIPPQRPRYLGAYACKIAHSLAVDRYRYNSAQKRCSVYDVALDELEETVPSLSRVETEQEAKELASYVNSFLRGLPEEDRTLFLRRYWAGDTVKELSHSMGRSAHGISVRLFRIRKKLEAYLKKEGMLAWTAD